ncbi:hypothetical protein NECAME_10988 [Necator americanus]|uniref:Uncharacterized protein n=1 Tax=Necator americanus TaxID=51031 RepID=W2T693_NECAM|nr:hypothetical protein NECAME_10988 [Necator americanus]ETN77530.1 hypothetical protein NECAME_10988 [Necator americanus]
MIHKVNRIFCDSGCKNRRQSYQQKADTFPVVPPDLDNDWLENSTSRATPRSTPRPSRSPRQIRFQIPEISLVFDPPRELASRSQISVSYVAGLDAKAKLSKKVAATAALLKVSSEY